MEVKITKSIADILTSEQVSEVKYIIETLRDDVTTPEELIRMVANAVDGYGSTLEVYYAAASVAVNSGTWNYYSDKSGDLDVWVEGAVLTYEGFYIIGAFLSDIWSLRPDVYEDFRRKISLSKFKEVL